MKGPSPPSTLLLRSFSFPPPPSLSLSRFFYDGNTVLSLQRKEKKRKERKKKRRKGRRKKNRSAAGNYYGSRFTTIKGMTTERERTCRAEGNGERPKARRRGLQAKRLRNALIELDQPALFHFRRCCCDNYIRDSAGRQQRSILKFLAATAPASRSPTCSPS